MVDICYANEIGEAFKEGIYSTSFLIRKRCAAVYRELIPCWFDCGLKYLILNKSEDFCTIEFDIDLECANKIFEIQKCVEFGADRVKFPYSKYSDYINRVFKAADKRISFEN